VREPEHVAQPGDVARNAFALGLALDPFELVRRDHAEAHTATLPMSFKASCGLSS
jgi:hypothetical protein